MILAPSTPCPLPWQRRVKDGPFWALHSSRTGGDLCPVFFPENKVFPLNSPDTNLPLLDATWGPGIPSFQEWGPGLGTQLPWGLSCRPGQGEAGLGPTPGGGSPYLWGPALLLGPACCRTLPWDRAGQGLKDSQADRELLFWEDSQSLCPQASGRRGLWQSCHSLLAHPRPQREGQTLVLVSGPEHGSRRGLKTQLLPLAAGPEQWEVQRGEGGRI